MFGVGVGRLEITGERIVKRALRLELEGEVVVPPVPFAYFERIDFVIALFRSAFTLDGGGFCSEDSSGCIAVTALGCWSGKVNSFLASVKFL